MITIVPISKQIDRKNFDCSIEELNTYLKQFAIPNDKKNIGKTFVGIEDAETLGYYTVSMVQILATDIPEDIKKGLPRYPVPAMRIGKLAVDTSTQGKGIGKLLLKDAFIRAVQLSSDVGLKFIIVDAINETAKQFYLKYGFMPLSNQPLTLIIALETVKMAVQG